MKLLKIIRNPITDHLPAGCKKIGTSFSAKKLVNPRTLVPAEEPVVVVVGAMAHGKVSLKKKRRTYLEIQSASFVCNSGLLRHG